MADRSAGRILYLQYTNPAAYPPIEHSAELFSRAGSEIVLLGCRAADDALIFRQDERTSVMLMPLVARGWRRKIDYPKFAAWATAWARRWRPDWIYASDIHACPAAIAVKRVTGAGLVYHEHDSPAEAGAPSQSMRWFLRARREVARRADVCVLPNDQRADAFRRHTGRDEVTVVWNCPLRREVAPPKVRERGADGLRVLYHGSIVPARLPATVIEALARTPASVSLIVAGYETAGHRGYVGTLQREAARLGVSARVSFAGALPDRGALLAQCATCDVGLAFMPRETTDFNERTMVGASNKPFDYMACGLALVVTDRPDWRAAYAQPGFAVTCDPESAASIASALVGLLESPAERTAMGERGRQQIASTWNYERVFAPVLEQLGARLAPPASELAVAHAGRESA